MNPVRFEYFLLFWLRINSVNIYYSDVNNVQNRNQTSAVKIRKSESRRSLLSDNNPNRLSNLDEEEEARKSECYKNNQRSSQNASTATHTDNIIRPSLNSPDLDKSPVNSKKRTGGPSENKEVPKPIASKCAKHSDGSKSNKTVEKKENIPFASSSSSRPRRGSVQSKQYQEPKLNSKMRR